MELKRLGSRYTHISIFVLILLWTAFVGAMVFLTDGTTKTVGAEEITKTVDSSALTPTVLHFQGNTEEGCQGDGASDIVACAGPFLQTNATLSAGPAASWTIANPALNGTNHRTIYDPSWIWNLTAPTRLGGPMTVDWWASCGGCGPGLNATWEIRIWADGVLVSSQRVIRTPDAPNVPKLLSASLFIPEINANSTIVLHIDPISIDTQNNTKIYYDSQLDCPGVVGGGPCDSKITMPVLAPGEIVPTPTPTPTPVGDVIACTVPTFDNYAPPPTQNGVAYPRRDGSGEPSVGVNWNTGNVMTMSRLRANRTTFDDSTSPANPTTTNWSSIAIPNIVTGLDPILFTDSVTGRTIGGELVAAGGATDGAMTDDDFITQGPNFTTGGAVQGFDHQTIGGGPPKVNANDPIISARQPITSYPHLFYYASQQSAYGSVSTSFDGGVTYGTAVTAYTLAQCNGLHGHIKVSPDGTVYLPNKNCGGKAAVVVSENNGLTWNLRPIPQSTNGDSDPSVGIGAGGKVYVSYTDSFRRIRVAVSDDKGLTWKNDISLMNKVTPNLTTGVFPATVAGDNNRAAVFFLATDSTNSNNPIGTDGAAADGSDPDPTDNFKGTWFPYMAITCDGGLTWTVVRADNDPLNPGVDNPAQQGVVCRNGTTCPDDGVNDTRNLLDFNDLAVDSRGRSVAVYADGCNFDHPCINITDNSVDRTQNQSTARLTIIRQRGGSRLFSAFDPGGPAAPNLSPPVEVEDGKKGYGLTWATPDNGGSKLLSYRIYRGEEGKKEKKIAEISAYINRFTDKKISKNKDRVYYRVTAVNKFGESPKDVKFFADGE